MSTILCPKCKSPPVPLEHGVALQQTWRGIPDFPGKEVVTMSPGGPGRLIPCLKCPSCGWSKTA